MHIAIDIRPLMEKQLTGVGEYTLNLLKELLLQDNTNDYYLFFNSHKNVHDNLPLFKQNNVHYCGFTWPNKLLNLCIKLVKYPKLDKLIAQKFHLERIDLFFFPNISFLSVACPYVITAHDISFEFFPEFLSLKRKLWHKIISPKKLFQRAKHIISVSQNTTRDLTNYYQIQPEKITTIYSGLADAYHKIGTSDQEMKKIKEKYNLPEEFILFLGTIEPRKNISGLMAAYKLLRQNDNDAPPLLIVGKLGWKYKKIVEDIKQEENIRLIEYINENEKKFFYNLASLFVYPSFYEGFGFPPVEALLCGCPVIASNNSSMLEICGDKAILVDPNNIADIAQAMKTVLEKSIDKNLTEKTSALSKNFSWSHTAQKTKTVFEDNFMLK